MCISSQVGTNVADPILRKRMYKREPLKPFATFFKEQMRLLKKANTPSSDPPPTSEHYTSFRKGQQVMINFDPHNRVLRGYHPKRGKSLKSLVDGHHVLFIDRQGLHYRAGLHQLYTLDLQAKKCKRKL